MTNEGWYIIIVGFLGLVSTIITSKGSLYDKRYKWYKRLNTRGWIVVVILISIILISINQSKRLNEQQTQNNEFIAKKINEGIEINRKKLFNDLSEALAKQNIELDTVKRAINKLRIIPGNISDLERKPAPFLLINKNGISHEYKNDSSIVIKLNIISSQANATNFKIFYFCELNFKDGTKTVTLPKKLFNLNEQLPKDIPSSYSFTVLSNKAVHIANIGFYGTYTDESASKTANIKAVYIYNIDNQETSFLKSEFRDKYFEKYAALVKSKM